MCRVSESENYLIDVLTNPDTKFCQIFFQTVEPLENVCILDTEHCGRICIFAFSMGWVNLSFTHPKLQCCSLLIYISSPIQHCTQTNSLLIHKTHQKQFLTFPTPESDYSVQFTLLYSLQAMHSAQCHTATVTNL